MYKNNDSTQIAEDTFFEMDFDYKEIPGKEYIESLNTITNFYDYTLKYAKKCGYSDDDNNAEELAKFIFELSQKRNVELSSLGTVKNWLKKASPTGNQSGRENVYKLCFALNLNAEQTGEFFLKAYLERPFNYKNINEDVYYFCLNNGIEYPEAKCIIETIEKTPYEKNIDAIDDTKLIGMDIKNIVDSEELIKYLCENRSGFTIQNKNATQKILDLIEKCKKLAEEEFEITHKSKKIENVDELLDVIYDYSARATENGEKVYKKSISKSNFPKYIKENFPQREQFKNIEKGVASFDVIRKALIMLKFYHFFADAVLKNKADLEQGLYDYFVDETNKVLEECGYIQLYWKNPYDWMFGYCACASNPLDEFRNLIYEFYLYEFE